MTLIASISGIRGTIGGHPGEALTPVDIVALTAGYGRWLLEQSDHPKVVIGRDGRISGPLVQALVINTLLMQGVEVIDGGLTATPTIEMGVIHHGATGGIIITASHNPMNWNALKLLDSKGEFLTAQEGETVLDFAKEPESLTFSEIGNLAPYSKDDKLLDRHIEAILALPTVDIESIRRANLSVVVDPVNSAGTLALPPLLDRLGVRYHLINDEIEGRFNHNPEPLADNLTELSKAVIDQKADLGLSVDPDVDRLAFMCEDGVMFGEEYTLVAIADHILASDPGPTVSNLSSSRALADITSKYDQQHYASAVGEAHVVAKMKEVGAVIGGEGNGGVIVPDLHFGRDALVGTALFLTYFVMKGMSMTLLKKSLPEYHMSKKKVNLRSDLNPELLLQKMAKKYSDHGDLSTVDGVKIDFEDRWVHMRKSNTEPVIRIYTEAQSQEQADKLANDFMVELMSA